jgi:hypothetical protein
LVVSGSLPAVGSSLQLSAFLVSFIDLSRLSVTSLAVWTSSNPSVATVSAAGIVTGVSPGLVEIDANYQGLTGGVQGSITFSFTLTGTVTDATTRQPIESARVAVLDFRNPQFTATTDALGRYTVGGILAATIPASVDVTASNYLRTSTTFIHNSNSPATLDIRMQPATPCPTLGFDDLTSDGASVTTSAMCGLTLRTTTSNWTVLGTLGRGAPSIGFTAAAGSTTSGEVVVTAGRTPFRLLSFDVSSAAADISYTITGTLNSTGVFTVQGTQGQTGGSFVAIPNPQSPAIVDTLTIRLSNLPAPLGQIALDNIRVAF